VSKREQPRIRIELTIARLNKGNKAHKVVGEVLDNGTQARNSFL